MNRENKILLNIAFIIGVWHAVDATDYRSDSFLCSYLNRKPEYWTGTTIACTSNNTSSLNYGSTHNNPALRDEVGLQKRGKKRKRDEEGCNFEGHGDLMRAFACIADNNIHGLCSLIRKSKTIHLDQYHYELDNDTFLGFAIKSGYNFLIQALIVRGAVNVLCGPDNEHPLFYTLKKVGFLHPIMRLLIQANGIQLDAKNMQGRTILHELVLLRDKNLVALVLEKGVNTVNSLDNDGATPLDLATVTLSPDSDIIKLLKQHGAQEAITYKTCTDMDVEGVLLYDEISSS